MSANLQHIQPIDLAYAVKSLQHKRANDPWDGPKGMARLSQLPPEGDWHVWLILAGRGWGKTATGAEWVRKRVQDRRPDVGRRIVIAGPTAADVRDIMIEGPSGLLAACDRAGVGVTYNPSNRSIRFANGARALLVSADEPNRFRGLNSDTFWGDELASWRYADAWDQLLLGHRLGSDPRGIVTTTPRPIAIVKDLVKESTGDHPSVVTTRGSTFENAANLSPRFIEQVKRKYEGTTLGRQELYAEIIDAVEGAFWNHSMFQSVIPSEMPSMKRVVVAIDPATTHGEDSDETGIAVVGIGVNDLIYVLHAAGYRLSPRDWATRAVQLYETYQADQIIAESNQGGEMVSETIYNACRGMPIHPMVRLVHAKNGKRIRAEPVVALYEQKRVFHVGNLATLEDQMSGFPVVESNNDDQVDALVHGIVGVSPALDTSASGRSLRDAPESLKDQRERHRRLQR